MTRSRRPLGVAVILVFTAIAFSGGLSPAAGQEDAYRMDPVAVSGDIAPGTGGLGFSSVEFADLNDAGVIALCGLLVDPLAYDEGIWVGTPGNLSLVVRTGDPVPAPRRRPSISSGAAHSPTPLATPS